MKIKLCIILIGLMNFVSVFGQRKIIATDSFKIQGKIKKESVFTLKALDSFPKQQIKDQIIYNHKGEIKDTIKKCKGVLFKTVLEKIEFLYEKPKELNEFYFVFTASDGYKVVFSWNEIYNTIIGDQLFFITEIGGKRLQDMEQRIIIASTADIKTGRRFIKGLEKIEVNRLD